jgi:hypothetical protein
MRDLLQNRRGTVAFATVIALVPLIGFIALGAEAGSWYVTKQQAQNAADAAAYSGALKRACEFGSVTCADTETVEYRGEQFAAQNAFCNEGSGSTYPGTRCAASLPSGISQSVRIEQPASNQVRATVSQTQPAYLVKLLGLSSVTIGATALAQIDGLAQPPCVLALTRSVTFQGSPTLTSPTCGVASNSAANNGIAFTGNNGIDFDAPSYTVGGCTQTATSGISCANVQTYQQTFPDPLSDLNTAMKALKLTDFPNGECKVTPTTPTFPASYEAGQCYNAGSLTLNNTTLSGTYYFAGSITINGNTVIKSGVDIKTGTDGATLIFFGSATPAITMGGNVTVQLTAVKHTTPDPPAPIPPAGPSVLSPVMSLMSGLLIYDGEVCQKNSDGTCKSNSNVNISGNSTSYFNGTVYVPNAPVTYGGNSSASAPTGESACYQVIAYSVNFQGDTKLDNAGCSSTGAVKPDVQTVRLVQ